MGCFGVNILVFSSDILRQIPPERLATMKPGGMSMNPKVRQLMAAFLLGALAPSLLLHFEQKRKSRFVDLPEITQPTQSSEPSVISPQSKQIYVQHLDGSIAPMELETYVVGVVLGEMPADFETEALKAQAVVARTYTLKREEEGIRHPMGAVCVDSGCCQAYVSPESYLARGGTEENLSKIRSAVEQTVGQVLTYEGALIEATYFSCSGGRTEDAAAVWGGDVPYLQSVDSPGEEHAAKYTAEVFFSKDILEDRLGIGLHGGPESWIRGVTYTEGGGVAALTIGGCRFTGVELRKLLELNSTAFSVTVKPEGILLTTWGHGHRVGMSQYGADAMAAAGNSYAQILLYYYQGTRIDKMDTLG